MLSKITAEFSSVDLADRAAAVIRGSFPEVRRIEVRSPHGRDNSLEGSEIINPGSYNDRDETGVLAMYIAATYTDRRFYPEPYARRESILSVGAPPEIARSIAGKLRNLGGLSVEIESH